MTSTRESRPETSSVHCSLSDSRDEETIKPSLCRLDKKTHPVAHLDKKTHRSVTSLLPSQTRRVIRSVMSSTSSFNHHHHSFNINNDLNKEMDNVVPSLVVHPSDYHDKNYQWVIPHVPVPGSYRSTIRVNYNENNTLCLPNSLTSNVVGQHLESPCSSSPSTSSDNISRSPSGSFCSRSSGSQQDLPANRIKLQWKDLSYTISKTEWKSKAGSVIPVRVTTPKQILQPQSGELVGGTITALMGPSGAGKSTLLSCITGRNIEGVSGDITVRYPSERKHVKIAYVPQRDYLFPVFTVRESLIFASKMKNVDKDHDKEARKVMQALNLESCADVRISGCSGGEIKRVSIGVELISGPNIIVLDEPTSGLDSTNAIKCIGLLRDLAETSPDAPAIVATIHQPNHRIFTDFHRIYLLSRTGQNIYFGSPDGLVSYFNSHALVQPDYSSPADYAIEVASGNYGQEIFDSLASEQKKLRAIECHDESMQSNKSTSLPIKAMKTMTIQKVMSKMRRKRSRRSLPQTWLLCWRSLQASCFKSSQLAFKITVNIVIAILISLLWDKPTGTEDGCWQSGDIREELLKGVDVKMTAREAYMDKITKITANCNLLFSTCVYLILVYSIGTVLVIPLEIKTVAKEISNSWYSVTSYFFAKTISDLPAVTLSILSLEIVCWLATHQVLEGWRFASTFGLSCLMGIICESMGVLIGITLSHDLVSATLVTMASSFPVLMFGGFLIKIADMPWYFKPMTYVSYTRYTFEGILAAVYGFGRCKEGAIDSVDFMKDLASAQNPLELISTLLTTFNVSREDARVFAPVIGVPRDHLESVINGTIEYLGLDDQSSIDDVTDVAVSSMPSQASYVMAYFKLNDSILQTSFISLVLIIFVIKVAIFYLLSIKTRRVN